jgi:hypothetical protein
LLGPDLCPRILQRTDLPVPLHVPDLRCGLLRNLCSGILRGLHRFCGLYRLYRLHGVDLYRLYGLDLCPCIFLGRPGLELLQQVFGRLLTGFGLTLIRSLKRGSRFVALRRVTCRRQNLSVSG